MTDSGQRNGRFSKWDHRTGRYNDCPQIHARKVYPDGGGAGEWVRGDSDSFGVHVNGRGVVELRAKCQTCQRLSSPIPHAVGVTWNAWNQLEWATERPRTVYPTCAVTDCEEQGVDRHHFAPRNTFRRDAEKWPTAPLCRAHHVEWHQRMDGYRRQKASDPA